MQGWIARGPLPGNESAAQNRQRILSSSIFGDPEPPTRSYNTQPRNPPIQNEQQYDYNERSRRSDQHDETYQAGPPPPMYYHDIEESNQSFAHIPSEPLANTTTPIPDFNLENVPAVNPEIYQLNFTPERTPKLSEGKRLSHVKSPKFGSLKTELERESSVYANGQKTREILGI